MPPCWAEGGAGEGGSGGEGRMKMDAKVCMLWGRGLGKVGT